MIVHNNAKLSTEVKKMKNLSINNPDANGILEIIKQFFAAITAILKALGIVKDDTESTTKDPAAQA